jgi:enoyl-CoA hydratase/carnithine racemase
MAETPAPAATLRYSSHGGIATITIDNPSRMNAMTLEMWRSLPDLIGQAEGDASVRGIAVTGAGDSAFCAGADISQFGERRSSAADVAAYDQAVAAGNLALWEAAKPTVALISGICFGGGAGLALCCDLRLASADSRFCIPAARLGLGYGFDNVDRLVRRIGVSAAADLLLSARTVDASDARLLGIATAVYSREAFVTDTSDYLARIAGNAPLTLKAVKRALVEATRPEAERDLDGVRALVAACFASRDYREGQTAFREKRKPVFTGT